MSTLLGTVLEREGASYRVGTAAGEVRAVLRGRIKRAQPRVVVGDVVRLEPEAGGELFGVLGVEPRRSLLARRMPERRGTRPVAANVDQVIAMTATRDPAPVPQLIDRLLVLAEANSIPAAVVINKIDLDPGLALAERLRRAGYPVHRTSAATGEGIAEMREALAGRTSVVTGPSGVGKSSLLNAVQPGLRLRTRTVSERIGRGRHTTVSAVMIPLSGGGFIMDTPGFSEVGLWGIEARELAQCFPEMRPLASACRYGDCRHVTEPGCAVRRGVEEGTVAADRYASYRALLEEIETAPKDWE
ncbi:MAG TPA: ribosome small subunit-dependent GTPase A [Gemmatimonadales bacterium]|nr:ribosome small subunit-dependent GTPase A [Gemmatimonadales bacterium]